MDCLVGTICVSVIGVGLVYPIIAGSTCLHFPLLAPAAEAQVGNIFLICTGSMILFIPCLGLILGWSKGDGRRWLAFSVFVAFFLLALSGTLLLFLGFNKTEENLREAFVGNLSIPEKIQKWQSKHKCCSWSKAEPKWVECCQFRNCTVPCMICTSGEPGRRGCETSVMDVYGCLRTNGIILAVCTGLILIPIMLISCCGWKTKKTASHSTTVSCSCQSGRVTKTIYCSQCRNTGFKDQVPQSDGVKIRYCDYCKGVPGGRSTTETCSSCRGTGTISRYTPEKTDNQLDCNFLCCPKSGYSKISDEF